MSADETQRVVETLFAAIESRDLRRVRAALAPDVTWQNVPHPQIVGRDAVVELLSGLTTWSSEVRWDVVTASYADDVGLVERVERFVLEGDEYIAECCGVFTVDGNTVTGVRDYVDLGEWESRAESMMERLRTRPPEAVVQRHLDAVATQDVIAMAADYGSDAELVRGDETYRGWDAIADYFDTVPGRLGAQQLEFGEMATDDADHVGVPWVITDDGRSVAAGVDTYTVEHGRITRQIVELDGDDF